MPPPDPTEVCIRPLGDAADCRRAEEIQLAAWGRDARSVTPAHVLLTAAHQGGLVLGAFGGGCKAPHMIGFTWGFLGWWPGDGDTPAGLKLCSHQTGVLPEWQGRGIGFRLKVAQREAALSRGLSLVTWTYDPLEAPNAKLNIAKLGGLCRNYLENLYGEGLDGPSIGLPTDRLLVEWWLASPRVRTRLSASPLARQSGGAEALTVGESEGVAISFPAHFDTGNLPRPPEPLAVTQLARTQPPGLWVEIPARFQTLKRADMALATAWRQHIRQVLTAAFGTGYLITDFHYEAGPPERTFYRLDHGRADPQLAN